MLWPRSRATFIKSLAPWQSGIVYKMEKVKDMEPCLKVQGQNITPQFFLPLAHAAAAQEFLLPGIMPSICGTCSLLVVTTVTSPVCCAMLILIWNRC